MIEREFFQRDPLTCARELIGCELRWDGCAGIIVETEAYAARGDEASHTFFRKSAREFVATHGPGAAYVYFNYGMYWMFNVLVKQGDDEGFVLFRALEPQRGIEQMRLRRRQEKLGALCSGPGKLAQALAITGEHHGMDLCTNPERCFARGTTPVEVVSDLRVGITKSAHLPWRFLQSGSAYASVAQGRVKAQVTPPQKQRRKS
ncbi:MAG: DNA-3-methyladenine glycosylase [Chthoniobacteraceae bacterium]